MSFTTPTIDVYLPGTTLGIGNVNAGIINIGKTGTEVNIAGSMNVMNLVTSPSCTMTSLTTGNLTTGNLIISPFSGDVSFNNFSAVNATFNTINSSNILIGPYPLNASIPLVNTNNINAITPSGSVSLYSNTTNAINIGGSTTQKTLINNPILQLNYTTLPTFTSNQVGYQYAMVLASNLTLVSMQQATGLLFLTLPIGVWNCSYCIRFNSSGTSTISSIFSTMVLTSVAINFPNNIGLSYINSPITVTTTGEYAVSGSGIISNATDSNVLKLNVNSTYTGNTLRVHGQTPNPFTYLIATRIA